MKISKRKKTNRDCLMVGEQVLPKGRILILKVSDDSQVDDIQLAFA